MRQVPKQLTLQDLRRMRHAASSVEDQSPPQSIRGLNKALPTGRQSLTKLLTNDRCSNGKAIRKTKIKGRSNCRKPQQFGCRQRVAPRGALVVPEGEEAAPLLLSSNPQTQTAGVAVSPEVDAYRAAVAACQAKRLRGGLKHRSANAKCRDPRFSDLCGQLDVASCAKAYSFVEEQQQQLRQQLQHVVKTGRVPHTEAGSSSRGRKVTAFERQQATKQLQRLESQQHQRKRRAAEAALKASLSREETERIAVTGKRPHYVSKRKLREMLREQHQQISSRSKNAKRYTDCTFACLVAFYSESFGGSSFGIAEENRDTQKPFAVPVLPFFMVVAAL
ncbi:hypothetical protein Efla_006719 [Eimeria flavescens]